MAPIFPVAKLAYLLVKQIGKPFATFMKKRAKNSHFFRFYICMPPAQFYHWMEVNIKMRMLNLGKPVEVPKLNEAMAIDLGAELLGEGIIFVIAAACLTAEYVRSAHKEQAKELARMEQIQEFNYRIQELEFLVSEQDARIRELSRSSLNLNRLNIWPRESKLPETRIEDSIKSDESSAVALAISKKEKKGLLEKVLDEVTKAVKK